MMPPTRRSEESRASLRHVLAIIAASCAIIPLLAASAPLFVYVAAAFAEAGDFASFTLIEHAVLFGLIVIGGLGADRFGAKPVALLGLAVMAVAAVGCAMAPAAVVFRAALPALYGGGALAFPALVELGLSKVDHRRWGALLFPWCALLLLMRPLLPLTHGFLIDNYSWRADFLLFAALAAGAAATVVLVPARPRLETGNALTDVFGEAVQEPDSLPTADTPPTIGLGVVKAALGLGLVLVAMNLALAIAVRSALSSPALSIALLFFALVAVAAIGLVADRAGPWLYRSSAVALAACCGLYALQPARSDEGPAAVALLTTTYLAASSATIAHIVIFAKAARIRVGLAAAVACLIYLFAGLASARLGEAIVSAGWPVATTVAAIATGFAATAAVIAAVLGEPA